jgi:transposase-like protein
MKISRARLAAVLTELGVDRGRRIRRVCPVGDADLRVLLEQGATVASLARRFSVAKVTVQRWLAGAGLLLADPAVDVDALSRLYVEQGRTIREVAAALGLPGPGWRWRWLWPASPRVGAPSGSPAAGGPRSPRRCCASCTADPRLRCALW